MKGVLHAGRIYASDRYDLGFLVAPCVSAPLRLHDMSTVSSSVNIHIPNIDLLSPTHALSRSSAQSESHVEYLLVELPVELADQLLCPSRSPQDLSIRGLEEDEAVLVTSSRSYRIKQVLTTNSLFVVSTSTMAQHGHSEKIQTIAEDKLSFFYELIPFVPFNERLESLLRASAYAGPEEELELSITQLTMNHLKQVIQCSDDELRFGLDSLLALEINGSFRILKEDYVHRALQFIFGIMEVDDLSMSNIDVSAMIASIQAQTDEFPANVLSHILKRFFSLRYSEDSGMVTLDERKIARFLGDRLLQSKSRWVQDEFHMLWRSLLPMSIVPDLSLLEGLYISESNVIDGFHLFYFPESRLPLSPAERFKTLFDLRSKWSYDEVIPYFRTLSKDPGELDKLLVKYTRSSRDSMGIRYLTSKL